MMVFRISDSLRRAGHTFALRGPAALVGGLAVMSLMFAGTQANAQRANFRYVGGRWSHTRHSGWHRYWGGPSVGFYYAPTPVYVVPGYAAPSYYSGPDFWTSNPSFGVTLNLGGGGYYDDGYYRSHRSYYNGGQYRDSHYYGSGSHYYGSRSHYYGNGGHSYSSGSHYDSGARRSVGGGRSTSGGHFSGEGRSRR